MSDNSFVFEGRVGYVFPDNFVVDSMIGPKVLMQDKEMDLDKLEAVIMKQYDPDFVKNSKPGDILVGGENFGHGHTHFQNMYTMRERLGIHVIIAESFQPVFYRNEVLTGTVCLVVPGITKKVERYDPIKVDYLAGTVTILKTGEILQGQIPSGIEADLTRAGDMVKFIREELARQEDEQK